ncbi:MAG: hypothetical protein Q8T08_07580 [Ignavibacteria bacterium]|nr:hypothetical protein [Ignavibacteria bacterium]
MDDIFKTLKDYFRFDRLQDIFLQVFELFLGLFAGGLLGALLTTDKPSNWLIGGTIASMVLSAAFAFNRLLKSSHFPNTAIDYLQTKKKMEEMTSELNRKNTIDEYIDKSIQALNLHTCPLTSDDIDYLCDNPLDDGLREVLRSVIQQPHYILDCSKSKFTVAIHLAWYPEKKPIVGTTNRFEISQLAKTIIFRDDFNIAFALQDDILDDLNSEGLKYEIHNAGRDTFNHVQLRETIVHNENQKLKLITAPIPQVCEGGKIGVLFLFCDEFVCKPKDLENILLIFGRIIANWISKYEDCIKNRGKV